MGETAVVKDNVTLYQGVVLGGTGKEKGNRHPIVEKVPSLLAVPWYWVFTVGENAIVEQEQWY